MKCELKMVTEGCHGYVVESFSTVYQMNRVLYPKSIIVCV